MDMQQLISEFLASEHGSQATQALADQGINADDAQQMLGQVAETAHAHVEEQGAGLLGEHPGKSFFAAFAAGLVKGDGVFRSLEEGGEGVLTGRVDRWRHVWASIHRLHRRSRPPLRLMWFRFSRKGSAESLRLAA